jgi:uncharacterized repeat protein (TIGR03803 family)
MSKNQTQGETSALFAVASTISDCAGKSATRGRGAATLTLAAALALTVGGVSPALAKDTRFNTLYSFYLGGAAPLGAFPQAGLVADKAGNLYGTAFAGGLDSAGTVFKLAPDGTLSTVYNFGNVPDGANPYAGVILDKAGNLYGTTYGGGADNYGSVFQVAPDGTETVLYSFKGGSDGASPIGGLLKRKGDLYGTTNIGGSSNYGTVFKVASNGTETVMHSFGSGTDGKQPWGTLIADTADNLYGTTSQGGADDVGTVFKVAPNGKEKVLYAFKGGNDGAYPVGRLIFDTAGNLYGTTEEGGGANVGTVFKLAPDGAETVLYAFKGGTDGAYVYASLIADGAGNYYGTTAGGGTGNFAGCPSAGCGTIFKLAPDGTETVLHSLDGASDGYSPFLGALTTDRANQKGALFGTATYGGLYGGGTIFSIKK